MSLTNILPELLSASMGKSPGPLQTISMLHNPVCTHVIFLSTMQASCQTSDLLDVNYGILLVIIDNVPG